jgi:peptidoglycan/LPS O-acetylase OafA/YrhL
VDWRPDGWEEMGASERVLRALTVILAALCLVALFVLAADDGPGSTSPLTWWLLVAAGASQLGASLASRRRVPSAKFWIQVVAFAVATVVFGAIALRDSGM